MHFQTAVAFVPDSVDSSVTSFLATETHNTACRTGLCHPVLTELGLRQSQGFPSRSDGDQQQAGEYLQKVAPRTDLPSNIRLACVIVAIPRRRVFEVGAGS